MTQRPPHPFADLPPSDFASRIRPSLWPEAASRSADPRILRGEITGRSDFDLNPAMLEEARSLGPPRSAAVLIPIVARAPLTVLFTVRAGHLTQHAGQVAFPGGRVEPGEDPGSAALRESAEEIGLDTAAVEPLGFIDTYRTGTGYLIDPLVGLVAPAAADRLTLEASEVTDTFEVPLSVILDPARHERHTGDWRGFERTYFAITYGARYIWGATAGMIRNLYERLEDR